jgi:hypothetical protein
MSFYEIEPIPVFAAGRSVSSQRFTAEALAGQYLMALRNTMDWVKHPTVKTALDSYYLTWQPEVNGVATEIENLGNHTSASAVIMVDADDEATTILSVPAAATIAAGGDLADTVTAP